MNKKNFFNIVLPICGIILVLFAAAIFKALCIGCIFHVNIKEINGTVQEGINNLSSQNDLQKTLLYPGKNITIQSGGNMAGFALSIKNIGAIEGTFSYEISAKENNCKMNQVFANNLISLGKSGEGIKIPSESLMEPPILVGFNISKKVNPCKINYRIKVNKNGQLYDETDFSLQILSR